MNSCLYRGLVRHRRRRPVAHSFAYRLVLLYLDLDELPQALDGRLFWSARHPSLAWFRRADFLGDRRVPLAGAVRALVEERTGRRPTGPIRLLTGLRTLGLLMNPVSFYYCFEPSGTRLEAVVAEITNTPWNERHAYVLSADGATHDGARVLRHRFRKAFHVSPFMPMEQDYDWRFSQPGERIVVAMENHDADGACFDATLALRRQPLDGRKLAGALCAHPWMSAQVAAGIYGQALRLWLKRAPFHPHPLRTTDASAPLAR